MSSTSKIPRLRKRLVIEGMEVEAIGLFQRSGDRVLAAVEGRAIRLIVNRSVRKRGFGGLEDNLVQPMRVLVEVDIDEHSLIGLYFHVLTMAMAGGHDSHLTFVGRLRVRRIEADAMAPIAHGKSAPKLVVNQERSCNILFG